MYDLQEFMIHNPYLLYHAPHWISNKNCLDANALVEFEI